MKKELTIHQNLELKHDIDSLKCNQCSKKFSHKHNVQWHMKSVHQGLLYSCEQCEYKTKQLVNLKIHMHLTVDDVHRIYPAENHTDTCL